MMASSITSNKRKFESIDDDDDDDCNRSTNHTTKRKFVINRRENMNHQRRPIPLGSFQPELGVKGPISILRKKLTPTDLDLCEGRLLLPHNLVMKSRLLDFLTSEEKDSVRNKMTGLVVRTFDWCGEEYVLVLKYLECNNAYRLINEWSKLLRKNDGVMTAGDAIEIQVFRIPGEGQMELGMVLLHHSQEAREETVEKEERNEAMSTEADYELEIANTLVMLSKSKEYIIALET